MGKAVAKRSRSHDRLVERAIEKAKASAALVPVKVEPYAPIAFASAAAREAATIRVELASMHVVGPDGALELLQAGEGYHGGHGRDDGYATRRGASQPAHVGPDLEVAALMPCADGIHRPRVLVGSLAAIRQAAPDQAAIDTWRAAGVVGVPVAEVGDDGALAYRYANVNDIVPPVQMELAARGLAFEAAGL